MPTIHRNGVDLNYQTSGAGPAILLTHGFGADHHMWSPQLEALGKTCRIITWDMRGHGQSGSPDDLSAYSEVETVADMKAILEAVDEKGAIIGGMSLGGYMSLAFHLRHEGMVEALLLVDTGPGFKNDVARENWNTTARSRGDRIDSEGAASFQKRVEAVAAEHRDYHGVAMAARGMLTQNDGKVIHSLPHIQVPTLIIVGAEDQPYLVASEYMANKIPSASKAVIPNAGHAANMDQPELFNQTVVSWLQK